MLSSELFARNLRQLRKSRGLTQAQLADQLFVSTQAVSKWERGESSPDISHVRKLTELLRVSADALLGIALDKPSGLLAVDGGGTKTEFALILPDGTLLQRFVLEGANPNNTSLQHSFTVLCQGIDRVLQSNIRLLGVYIGCAGMSSGNNAATITALLKKQYPGIALRCQSDIYNLLACAKDPNNAIAAICGTGCAVFATANDQLYRAGGGGWKLDPVGSGYELGRRALLAALEHRDGTGQPTLLTQLVEQKLSSRVWDHIPDIYTWSPDQIADFAPLTIHAWEQGDEVADRIVEENCRRIAHLICASSIKTPEAAEVLLNGSIFSKCAPFRQRLKDMLPDYLAVTACPYPPVWGACLQCAALCRLSPPNIDIFMEQYSKEVTTC